MRGLNQHPAKVPFVVIRAVGSNPTITAILWIDILSAKFFNKETKMKPGKTFKLASSYKTMIALMPFKDKDQRDAFKRMMIQAQLASEVRPVREKSDRK